MNEPTFQCHGTQVRTCLLANTTLFPERICADCALETGRVYKEYNSGDSDLHIKWNAWDDSRPLLNANEKHHQLRREQGIPDRFNDWCYVIGLYGRGDRTTPRHCLYEDSSDETYNRRSYVYTLEDIQANVARIAAEQANDVIVPEGLKEFYLDKLMRK